MGLGRRLRALERRCEAALDARIAHALARYTPEAQAEFLASFKAEWEAEHTTHTASARAVHLSDMRITGRQLRAVERALMTTWGRWLETLTLDELDALAASLPPSEMDTRTLEQLEACGRGVPLEVVRAMGTRKADG